MHAVSSDAERLQFGDVAGADLLGERAAGPERAARRRAQHVRRRAGDRRQALPPECRQAGQQTLGVRVRRVVEDRRTSPRSTARPAYITCTRSAMRATTPRSWVMNTTAVPSSFWMRWMHLEDLGLDRDVECRGRLVGDQHLGVVGDRHRDHHALAHATRELVRVLRRPRPSVAGCRRCRGARPNASAAASLDISWCERTISATCEPILCVGLRADSGSWKIIEMRLPRARWTCLRFSPDQLLAADLDRPLDLGRLRQQTHGREERHRLARTALADDAEHLARRAPSRRRRARLARRRSRSGT